MNRKDMMTNIQKDWGRDPHWENIKRTCSVADVGRLSGSLHQAYADVRLRLEKLWNLSKRTSTTNKVVRLSLITIILTLVVAITGCSTTPQYQYNQRVQYSYEGATIDNDDAAYYNRGIAKYNLGNYER